MQKSTFGIRKIKDEVVSFFFFFFPLTLVSKKDRKWNILEVSAMKNKKVIMPLILNCESHLMGTPTNPS